MPSVSFSYLSGVNQVLWSATFASGMHGFASDDGFSNLTRTQADAFVGAHGASGDAGASSSDSWSLQVATNQVVTPIFTHVVLRSSESFQVYPGSSVWVEAWAKEVNQFRDTALVVGLDFYNASGTLLAEPSINSPFTGGLNDSSWSFRPGLYTVPSNAHTARVRISFATTLGVALNTGDVWYLDWVTVTGPKPGEMGRPRSWTVPPGADRITITCKGAAGGGFQLFNNVTSNGGLARGTFDVTPGETLWIYVGGAGNSPLAHDGQYGVGFYSRGGWNGGGDAGRWWQFGWPAFGGGGATDVRRGGQTLAHRIIVAGGGGGAHSGGGTSGRGGGPIGGSIIYPGGADQGTHWSGQHAGQGGSQTAGGEGAANSLGAADDGALGQGGRGATQTTPDPPWGIVHPGGAGGGGGYYGGGGGALTQNDGYPGGGGSGWVHPDAAEAENVFSGGAAGAIGGATPTGHGSVTISWDVPAVPFTETIANFGTNDTPRGHKIRVGQAQWAVFRPEAWPQFMVKPMWNGEYYLSGGSNGLVGKSYDLRRWTWTRAGDGQYQQQPAWNGEYWLMAVAGGSRSARSYDGETWEISATPQFEMIMGYVGSLAWGNGRWVAGHSDGLIYTSTDGLNWTPQVVGRPNQLPNDPSNVAWTSNVTWTNGASYMPGTGFVLIGRSRSSLGNNSGGAYFAFSPDGISWSYQLAWPPDNDSRAFWNSLDDVWFYAIANSDDEYVAVGKWLSADQTFTVTSDRPIIFRSTNGVNWDYIDPGPNPAWDFQMSWMDILWTGTVFIAGGSGGDESQGYEFTSPDGAIWSSTPQTADGINYRHNNVNFFHAPTGLSFEEHPWHIERWAGHPQRMGPQDGPQPLGPRFGALGTIAHDPANGDIIAVDIAGQPLSLQATQQYYHPHHNFMRLDGKVGTTFLRVPYSTQTPNSQGTVNAEGTGSYRMARPNQVIVSPDGRFLFAHDYNGTRAVIHRVDLETMTARPITGLFGGNMVDGFADESGVANMSPFGMVGFHPSDGHLYFVGVQNSLDCHVRRIEGWSGDNPYTRTIAGQPGNRDGLNSSEANPDGPLTLRFACFYGEDIWAVDGAGGRRCLYRIPPPYDWAYLATPNSYSTLKTFFDIPCGITTMNGMLYIAEGRGQIVEVDPQNPTRASLIAGNGKNLNGAELTEVTTGFDALETSMAALSMGLVSDGRSNLYVPDTNGSWSTGMQIIQRITQGTGVPALRLRQRDDNPR